MLRGGIESLDDTMIHGADNFPFCRVTKERVTG